MKDRTPVVVFDADKVSSNADDSARVSRVLPAWIISCCVNAGVLAAFFLMNTPEAETAPTEVAVFETLVENQVQPPNLENDDIGLDPNLETNYNVDRIEEVSVPGPVNAMDPIGVLNADPGPPMTLPPPPGVGGGQGGGVDASQPGKGSMIGFSGGIVPNHLFQPGGFGGRSGATRQKMLIEGGGNAASEAAVARGLKFIAQHQGPDGSWSLQKFREHGRCNCTGGGQASNDVAGTAFGLIPLLGAGQTHKPGSDRGQIYTKEVDKGLRWLVLHQNREGGYNPNSGEMYSHGLATIALCEAYGLTSDPALREPCQRALNFIVMAQTPEGGWRYHPKSTGYDGSIGAWQLMALKSGQMAGLDVPRETLTRATKWLDAAAAPDGGRYGYTTPHPANGLRAATTSAGLLCRQYLGWGPRSPGLLAGMQYLRAHKARPNDMYYSYYATQVMHHMGGQYWAEWNPQMRDGLINSQDKGDKIPHQAGSWYDPTDAISSGRGGRIMQTALSLVTLEVYYRHLPLYRREVGGDKDVVKDK
ncbi:MAG: prenyltransferase/squalene oxidase repeat-containing protein [Gemmataceae bacterium]